MTTTQAKRTHCKNCGMKLPEQPLSLCAYCAMPLDLGDEPKSESGDSPNAARIGRVVENADYAEAMEWTPPEGPEYWKAKVAGLNGRTAIVIGVVLLALTLVSVGSVTRGFAHPAAWLSLAVIATGVFMIVKSLARLNRAVAMPLLRRPAIITDRRSETAIGNFTGKTTYFFSIEFEGGVTGEFTYPGRGSHEDPYSTNLPGVAYTRGPELLSFKHIRV